MALISCFEILRCSEIDAVSCSKLLENVDLVSFVKANTERCFQVGEYVSRLWALNKFYFLQSLNELNSFVFKPFINYNF